MAEPVLDFRGVGLVIESVPGRVGAKRVVQKPGKSTLVTAALCLTIRF